MSTKATVPATEFKAKCLELMDRVAEGRDTYVITKRGKPVAKLVPADPPETDTIFGCMADQTEFVGPLDLPAHSDDESRRLDAERARQLKAWEAEWRRFRTISGKKPSGPHKPPSRRR